MGLVIYPGALLSCLVYPVSLCRVFVFLTGISTFAWFGLTFLSVVSGYVLDTRYGILWDAKTTLGLSSVDSVVDCVCSCEGHLTKGTRPAIAVLDILVIQRALGVSFRTLKGLRQSRWATLLSITYSVPIHVFPVQWSRPDEKGGGPIQFRARGQPVQEEPAFDPFALMDEQPESWRSSVILHPELDDSSTSANSNRSAWAGAHLDVKIACCGFPSTRRDGTVTEDDICSGSTSKEEEESLSDEDDGALLRDA